MKHGPKRVEHMRRRHVLNIKAALAETPRHANKVLKRLSQLMELAVELEWRTDNPVRGVARYRIDGTGYHTWDEGEITRFYEVHPFGSPAYLAMALILYTGASRVDVVKLGKGNVRDGRIVYRRQTTRRNPKGILVDVPIHGNLAAALEAAPEGAFTFLETRQGRPAPRTASVLGCASGAMLPGCRRARRTDCARRSVAAWQRPTPRP